MSDTKKDPSQLRQMLQLTPLPKGHRGSHKGEFGRALLVGGSTGMAGAIALAGKAALRSGAGLVTLAIPNTVAHTVATFEPSYMTLPLRDKGGCIDSDATPSLLEKAAQSNCLACGPGLGRSRQVTRLVSRLYRQANAPAVFDADALFALAESPRGLSRERDTPSSRSTPSNEFASGVTNRTAGTTAARIITPHLGEFRRLVGEPDLDRPAAVEKANQLAAEFEIIVLLKGADTLVTDGNRQYINTTGNPGMATGGTGDVLTGIIAGFLARGLPPFEAAAIAAYLHGIAGDLAAADLGEVSLIASDLLNYLPQAIQQHVAKQQNK